MLEKNFDLGHGVIPACDVEALEALENIVRETSNIRGIVGYKVGCILALKFGLSSVVKIIRDHSNLPVIYDHQKAGTDIPMLAEEFAKVLRNAGVDSVIIFPQAGPETESSFVKAVLEEGMIPIIGGEMPHPKYLSKDGGFLDSNAPSQMYRIGAKLGAKYFVVPGNKPTTVKKYSNLLSRIVDIPRFLLPGIGRQGGDIETAFEATGGKRAYAIIGSGIYKADDIRESAKGFCNIALQFE